MQGRVYLVTNTVNQKQYVGQTITQYSKQGHGHAVKAAYAKYGRKAFTYETVCGGINNHATLDFAEKFWIKVMNSVQPNGYNLEEGGRRRKVVHHKPTLGKKLSEETKAKMSASQREYWASLPVHPHAGKKASDETKAKMSASHTGRKQSDEERKMRSESMKQWHKSRKENS